MAHRTIALDIGSHSVKVLAAESSFGSSSAKIRFYLEEPIAPLAEPLQAAPPEEGKPAAPSDDNPPSQQAADANQGQPLTPAALVAIERLKEQGLLEGDAIAVNYSLAHCLQTDLDLPATLKRDKVEEVLAIQIEDHFPVDPDTLQSSLHLADQIDQEGLRKVMVVSTPFERIQGFLAALEQQGVDPVTVEVSPARLLAACHTLVPALGSAPVAVIDIGHSGSDLCILEGDQIKLLRRINLGGADFTQALADQYHMPWDRAETGKHREGHVEIGTSAPAEGQRITVGLVCRKVASSLAEELSRTFHAFLAREGKSVERLLCCGGGSLLKGLTQYLSLSLGIPTEPLAVGGIKSTQPDAGVKAVGSWGSIVKALGRRPASQFNLRRGSLAYRGSFEFLQSRIPYLLVFFLLLVGALVFSTLTRRSALVARRSAFEETLVSLSQPVFGEAVRNPREVISRLQEATTSGIILPEYSAYELFRDISEALVDLRELGVPVAIERITIDIQRDVITIRGSTDSAISIDEIRTELGGLQCITDVTQERTTQNRTTGDYEFELRAVNSCS
ncbi:MAG: pilus assembly protein PilM [Bradymonadales bacterium]|nr:pilus assembly protein PilM [Bradymonadales bacterium]